MMTVVLVVILFFSNPSARALGEMSKAFEHSKLSSWNLDEVMLMLLENKSTNATKLVKVSFNLQPTGLIQPDWKEIWRN
jgi:hypothetical protein